MEYLPQNLEKWHIMVDEIDSYQTDGVYRPALENVIDYFFRFPERKPLFGIGDYPSVLRSPIG